MRTARCSLLLAAMAAGARGDTMTKYSGYLIDLFCYGRGVAGLPAPDGSDVLRGPENHTLHCLRDPANCRNGGYMMAQMMGTEYHPKFTFDEAGNTAVLAFLDSFAVGDPLDNAGSFFVTASGMHNGDGVLRSPSFELCTGGAASCDTMCVSGMCEADGTMTTYSGYLIDLYCYGLGLVGSPAPDGSDVLHGPENHTLMCLRGPANCRNGGYMVAQRMGTEYHPKFKFDAAGNAAVLAWLDSLPSGDLETAGNFFVTVTGKHNGDGVMRSPSFALCTGGAAGCDGMCTGMCETTEQTTSSAGRSGPGAAWALLLSVFALSDALRAKAGPSA